MSAVLGTVALPEHAGGAGTGQDGRRQEPEAVGGAGEQVSHSLPKRR